MLGMIVWIIGSLVFAALVISLLWLGMIVAMTLLSAILSLIFEDNYEKIKTRTKSKHSTGRP